MAIPLRDRDLAARHPATDPARLVPLDALRAIAVLLVIGRHLHVPASLPQGFLRSAAETLQRGGWVGVDLFFVLSGFLVSGLLFREHLRFGRLQVGRFLIRRGLKIYPAFYVFLLSTLALRLHAQRPPEMSEVLAEVFFVQNYVGGMWNHTWSLAVEEHFYLLIPVLLLLLSRGRTPERAFGALPWIALGCIMTLLAGRLATGLAGVAHFGILLFPTHFRIDGLMLGVLLSWAYHYRGEALGAALLRWRGLLLGLGCALLLPAFVFPLETTLAIPTVGLTLFAIGSACLLSAGLAAPPSWHSRLRPMARIGAYSYSIYLWHLPMITWAVPWVERSLGSPLPFLPRVALSLVLCIGFGIGIARLVELRVLKLRDRWFPSRSRDLSPPTPFSGLHPDEIPSVSGVKARP